MGPSLNLLGEGRSGKTFYSAESLGVRRIEDVAARLVGESKSAEGLFFLFAFDVTEKTPRSPRFNIPIQVGFVYIRRGDKEERYCDNTIGSITGHDPYWKDPTTEFTTEEIDRIVNLPPLGGDGKPLTPEELEWNRKQFPH